MPESAKCRTAYAVIPRSEWALLEGPALWPRNDTESDPSATAAAIPSARELVEVYRPLVRHIGLQIDAASTARSRADAHLGALRPGRSKTFVVAVAGGVCVGKSTFARTLRALLSHAAPKARIDLVSSDSFLHANRRLAQHNLMQRKGYPESYDTDRMIAFLADLKAGVRDLRIPVYSHDAYDILPRRRQRVDQPDVLIFDGLNVLQTRAGHDGRLASDCFDWSIFVDADETDIRRWFVDRIERWFAGSAERWEQFHGGTQTSHGRTVADFAIGIWESINKPNLNEYILPTRSRADLVLRKGPDHAVFEVWLR